MKRSIIIFLAMGLTALGAAFGMTACKQNTKIVYTESGLCLEEHEEGYTVCGIGTYEGTQILIPENFEEKPITEIGEKAFYGCGQIEQVTIPQTITWIGPGAFSGCTGLSEIEIPHSVTLIGNHAFSESGLTGITIPDSVTSLGDNAFRACKKLTKAEVPGSVGELRWNVFAECTALSDVTLGEGITEVRTRAFSFCNSLQTIELPESVVSIGRYAFEFCSSLEGIHIPKDVTYIGGFSFRNCTSLDTFSIPQKVSQIGEDAFSDTAFYNDPANWRNDTLCLDDCLIHVKKSFVGELSLEKGTRLIADKAAFGCEAISSLTIPDGVLFLGKESFAGCAGLISVTIPDSLLKLGSSAFHGCEQIKTATMPTFVIPSIAKTSLEKVILTSGEDIGPEAFCYCGSLLELEIRGGVISIGEKAFYGCSRLISATFGSSVTTIGKEAFSDCRRLLRLEIPDSVTTIGEKAFYHCLNLTSVTLGSGVKEIEEDAFENCYKLIEVCNGSALSIAKEEDKNGKIAEHAEHVFLTMGESYQTVQDGFLFYEDEDKTLLLGYIGEEKQIVLPQLSPGGKKYAIYKYAFAESSLHSMVVPTDVTEIGEKSFMNCSELFAVYYSGDVSEWKKINGSSNVPTSAVYYFSATEPTKAQWKENKNWWHYGEGNMPEAWENEKR